MNTKGTVILVVTVLILALLAGISLAPALTNSTINTTITQTKTATSFVSTVVSTTNVTVIRSNIIQRNTTEVNLVVENSTCFQLGQQIQTLNTMINFENGYYGGGNWDWNQVANARAQLHVLVMDYNSTCVQP